VTHVAGADYANILDIVNLHFGSPFSGCMLIPTLIPVGISRGATEMYQFLYPAEDSPEKTMGLLQEEL
jgi:hypothetical protein